MGKLLRVMIVLMLILSIGSLVLGTMLFLKREEYKGRTLTLEEALKQVAATIEKGGDGEDAEETVTLNSTRLQTYYGLDVQGKKVPRGEGTMHASIKDLVGRANVQYTHLKQTRTDLARTKEELADTQQKLADTERQLADARNTIEEQKKEIARIPGLERTIADQKDEIASLERRQEELNDKIQAQTETIAQLETEKQSLQDKLAEDVKTIRDLRAEVERLKRGEVDEPDEVQAKLTPGRKGRVEIVNNEWNFVVISLDSKAHVVPSAELLVHRDDDLVGKVRILQVKRPINLAVADIMNEWTQSPIQEGDHVAF